MFYTGCPAWGYKGWVGSLFPERTQASEFLSLYSRKLTTVEGNTTFYATPSQETIARWVQDTPETFHFCPKVSRSISHASDLNEHKDETLQFIERMKGLGSRLGPIFLQLPPAFGPDQLVQLEHYLAFWPSDIRLAVEVRHPQFYEEAHAKTLDNLLTHYHMARVMMDTRPLRTGSAKEQKMLQARERKPDLPLHVVATTDFVFVRYIGHPRLEINLPFIESWAQQMSQWIEQRLTIYAFCHCPFEEFDPTLCNELYRRVSTFTTLPPLPLEVSDALTIEQGRLF